MRNHIVIGLFLAVVVFLAGPSVAFASEPCAENDIVCRYFSSLAGKGQFEKIIAQVQPDAVYSTAARDYIGQAYLVMAGRESNTLEQEERYCRQALAYGATSAYMGLYFIHAGSDPVTAVEFLRQYVKTDPRDSVPYVILGEFELEQRNYLLARSYLGEARKFARGRSSNLDWLTFQANYLLGDYAAASAMLDSAMAQGQPLLELKLLMTDPRFLGLENRPEFRKYGPVIKDFWAMATH